MIQFWRRLSDPMTHHQVGRLPRRPGPCRGGQLRVGAPMVFKSIRDSLSAAAPTWDFSVSACCVIQDHPAYIQCGQRWPLRPELAASLGVCPLSQLTQGVGGSSCLLLSGGVAVLCCCIGSRSYADQGGLRHALAGRMLPDDITECGGRAVDGLGGQAGEQRPQRRSPVGQVTEEQPRIGQSRVMGHLVHGDVGEASRPQSLRQPRRLAQMRP